MERRTLTIDLRHEGPLLLRSYHAPGVGSIDGVVPIPQPLAEIGAGYRTPDGIGVAALAAVLGRGALADLDAHLGGAQLDRAGEALFEVLFGADDDRWRTVLRVASRLRDEVPNPIRVPFRIRVLTDVPALLGLPWRVTQWKGYLLRDHGWTFEVASQSEPRGPTARIDYRSPGRVLVVAPPEPSSLGGPGALSIEVDRHVEDLTALFDNICPGFSKSDRLHVARSHDELRAASARGADFVYFYGHGVVREGKPHLCLGNGPADWLQMRDLAHLLKDRPPRAVFLNGCWTAHGGWHAAGHQLLALVPLVVANSTVANAAAARRFALDWIESWLGRGHDPVEAANARPGETKRLSDWTPAVVYADYETWETSRPPSTRIRLDRAEDWLDRDAQRGIAFKNLTDFVRNDRQRVEAILAFSTPGNSIEHVFRQISDFVEREAGERIHIRRLAVPFPDGRDLAPERFERWLEGQLGVGPAGKLAPALAAKAPAPRGDAKRVLWLDWGVLRGRSTFEDEVFGWLEFARDYLATAEINDFRVVVSLALEAEGDAFDQLAHDLPDLRGREDLWTDRFRCTALDPLGTVKKADLLTFLEQNGCDPGDVRKVADAIFHATEGHYDKTRELLREGIRLSWRVLLHRIGAPPPRRGFGAGRPASRKT